MNAHFAPCESCGRHIRVSEGACPFCDAKTSSSFRARAAPTPPGKRLSRAALLVFGAASVAACGGSTSDGGTTDGGSDAATDGAKVDTGGGVDTAVGTDTATDTTVSPAYGLPADTGPAPTDAGVDTSPPEDAPAPPYGIPP